MEFPKRERAFLQACSPRRSPKATRPGAATGADENASPKHPVPVGAASPQRKKVLGERNDGGGVGGMEGAASPQPKSAPSPPTLAGRGGGPYDPKTNYTTPRPPFLRYDPERRREILLRVSRAAEVMYDDSSSTTSGNAASEEDGGSSVASDAEAESPISSAARSDSETELDDSEEEEEVVPARRGRWARRLFLLLTFALCYIYCSNPSGFPTYSEDAFDLGRGIGGMYDSYDHELDSLRLLGMGPEDVLEENTNQIVHEDTKSMDENGASPRNLVAVTVMGLADICLNVSLGELTCQIGSERSEIVPDLKKDSEMDKQDTEMAVFLQNDDIPPDSIGSTSTHTDNMEEGSSESVHLEECDDSSNQCELQSVSMEKAIKSASYKMDRKGLESEELDIWQYENTAEAAKAIFSTVKFMWSAMEPHFLQILACLSFAGLVAALYRYYQRSREHCIITCDSLAEEPLLVPHQVVELSMTSSAQDAQLPVHSSEEPMQLAIPNQNLPGSLEVPMELTLSKVSPLVSLEDPVQETLPKTDPLLTLKVPIHSHCSPVVEQIGEFMFADSVIQSPSVRRAKEEKKSVKGEKKSVKGEKTNATAAPLTPTPLRRSSRLRNKVTTP